MRDLSKTSLSDLWADPPPSQGVFDATLVAKLPEVASRYLRHTIAAGTPLATAVRLTMQGSIKLKKWRPFHSEQVIRRDRGMIWQAKTKLGILPIAGSDRFIDGQGEMRWKLFGVIPMIRAGGPDITKSAAGRFLSELIWLPSALLSEQTQWQALDAEQLEVSVAAFGHRAKLWLKIDEIGALREMTLARWGNPEGGDFREVTFGATFEEEGSFGGYTIPTRFRAGWFFGSERFEPEGEFFRATISHAEFV